MRCSFHLRTKWNDSIQPAENDQALYVDVRKGNDGAARLSAQCSWIGAGFLPRAYMPSSRAKNSAADVSTMVAAEEMSKEKLKNIPVPSQNAPSSGEMISRV